VTKNPEIGPILSVVITSGQKIIISSDGRVSLNGQSFRLLESRSEPELLLSVHDARKSLNISRTKHDIIKKKHRHLSGNEREKAIIDAMIREAGPEKAQAFADSLKTH
jgi:hypothetical protein